MRKKSPRLFLVLSNLNSPLFAMMSLNTAIRSGVRRLRSSAASASSASAGMSTGAALRPTASRAHGGMQKPGGAPTSTTWEKMEEDARYQATGNVPEQLLNPESPNIDERFSMGKAHEGRAIYLDFQATTPTDPRVTDAMLPYLLQGYGNPHSNTHSRNYGATKNDGGNRGLPGLHPWPAPLV